MRERIHNEVRGPYLVGSIRHLQQRSLHRNAAAPRTSSEALVHATLPFGLQLADQGLDALKKNKHLARGLNVLKGEITHPAVAQALGKDFKDPHKAFA